MFIYWLLFAIPALMALFYPVRSVRPSQGQVLALIAYMTFYVLVGLLRHETGGDWDNYDLIFEDIRTDNLAYALVRSDPAFGLLNWFSAQVGGGHYLVNGVCCLLLGYGVARISLTFREMWLSVLIAVPYLLIVVGMGYIRQGAAIGLMLTAIASLDRARPVRTVLLLLVATTFHSSAAITFPLFVFALIRGNKALAVAATAIGLAAFVFFFMPQLERFETNYIDAEYGSSGALVRVLMGVVPAMLVLLRWRSFPSSERVRSVWLMIALVNIGALIAYVISPSSTAVDRLALFVSVIQLAAFGEIRALLGITYRMTLMIRMVLIVITAMVQLIFLVFAVHADLWVPYRSIFETL